MLIETKSTTQSLALLGMEVDSDSMLKEIKPHFGFSYGKGVVFSADVYDFTEEEILEMSSPNVWKVFKVPRSTMIILTFVDEIVPSKVTFDSINVGVRPYRPRPLQCYNCYGYGHASQKCTREKVCDCCSQSDHGICSRPPQCINCKESHRPRYKKCKSFKKEEEALLKAKAEHISVGHAKKLLAASRKYSEVVLSSNRTSESKQSASIEQNHQKLPLNANGKRNVPKPRRDGLSPSELEISVVSRASTSETSRVPCPGPSEISISEVSQASSLPDLGSQTEESLLTDVPNTVVVHRSDEKSEMEAQSTLGQVKRGRSPSPPSPSPPPLSVGLPTSNRFELLMSDASTSDGKGVPKKNVSRIPRKEYESKAKPQNSKPSLTRNSSGSLQPAKKSNKTS